MLPLTAFTPRAVATSRVRRDPEQFNSSPSAGFYQRKTALLEKAKNSEYAHKCLIHSPAIHR